MYSPTFKSYFSGAGGLDLGLIQGGLTPVMSLELDVRACKTHSLNFDHPLRQEDITNTTVLDQDHADVYVATYPCTKYSDLADIHGTRSGDDLFLHFLARTVSEMFEGQQTTKNRIFYNLRTHKFQHWALERIQLEQFRDGSVSWEYCTGQDDIIEYPQIRKALAR
ncbi:hypothetical protein LCGC14_0937890 [marine sediment metagenome]|uniref:DNA (cytosine-5-)-methyltransferase n=1 Tax=marine sediment metagenome TaxID=412755 RepID=A0A0F9RSA0_9ZZZZ